MPESLFQRFDREWHCPTAIHASNLEAVVGSPVILVGDPRSLAANLNDPKGTQHKGQSTSWFVFDGGGMLLLRQAQYTQSSLCGCFCCSLSGTVKGCFRQQESIPPSPHGPVTVPDDFVVVQMSVELLGRVELFIAADGFKGEALVPYETAKDKGAFWNSQTDCYCSVCFGKTHSADNLLLACATATCSHRFHRLCLLPMNSRCPSCALKNRS